MLVRNNDSTKRVFVKKSWGYEEWIVNDPLYCMKFLVVFEGEWTSKGLYHYHKLKDETFYVLEGSLLLETVYNKTVDKVTLTPRDSYRIKPNIGHRFTAVKDTCKFIEVSTQHFDSDSYRSELKDLP